MTIIKWTLKTSVNKFSGYTHLHIAKIIILTIKQIIDIFLPIIQALQSLLNPHKENNSLWLVAIHTFCHLHLSKPKHLHDYPVEIKFYLFLLP